MQNIFGIIGWSGSGKTDLICRLINYLSKKEITVSSIKHSHHNFQIDKEGKDSFKHLQSGSKEVIIFGDYKYAIVSRKEKEKIKFENILEKITKKVDIILIEGMKKNKIKKIEVYRSSIHKPLLCVKDNNIKALVYDKITPKISKLKLPKFQFKETKNIGDFILKEIQNDKKS